MNIRTIVLVISIMLIPLMAAGKEPVKTISIDTIQVLKIASQDERAVVKTTDGKIRIIKVGDPIGDHGKVIEIAADRVVFEEQKSKEMEKVIIRLIDGKQNIERLRKTGEQSAPLVAPAENDEKTKKQEKILN